MSLSGPRTSVTDDLHRMDLDIKYQDLCARLPYFTIVQAHGRECMLDAVIISACKGEDTFNLEDVKPYLKHMSDMTQAEREDMLRDTYYTTKFRMDGIGMVYEHVLGYKAGSGDIIILGIEYKVIDWLYRHHYDFRGLIEKGMAIRVTTENNPYNG